ncbi:exopolysaccharide transport family protein [Paraburkholderia xenovorans LB400]|uniref:Putative tyrosine-protein kinase EpsB n=1 Tax=Paraburkholderia xenovorans (strain LB400) TaxID=266265 RepID=Q13G36_PARXL|nr:polysaccharide biosynthesis tyrosine autokinase [Paraburkholderia xenovorans]ABE36953.1 Exopolysaccharide transport protein [Paraburkholderia xenovorans LB400]AIP34052.1 exopolysaccharide transport family protein [Paraburkholderia xenovorans LB400]
MASVNKNRFIDSSDGDEIHLSDYLSVVAESWKLIVAIAATVLIIGTLYAFIARPVYRADAMIQVEDSANATKDALGELASIFDTKQTADAEIELIRSRLVVGQTVQSLHLDISAQPRYFPLVGAILARHAGDNQLTPPLFGLVRFAWGGEKIDVSLFDVPHDRYDVRYTLVARGGDKFDLLDPDGDVVLHGQVGSVAHGSDPAGPVELRVARLEARPGTHFILSRASTLLTIDQLQNALVIAEKTKQSGVIGVSLDGADSRRTAEIINTIAATYVQQNIDRKSAEAEHTLSFLDQQLPQLRTQLDQAEDRYNAFRNQKGTVDLTEESRLLLQQIVDSKTKLVDLQQQQIEMAQRFTPSHPGVVALDAQIASLEEQQTQLNKRVSTLPDTEQSALRLLRDVRVNTELYTNLLDSAQQLRIVKAGQVGNVRVVDRAVAGEVPVKPKRALVVVLAAVLGLIAGTAAAFVKNALFGGVENSEEIEQALGLPVYAAVPHSETQVRLYQAMRRGRSGHHVLASIASHDVAIEGIRSLRTALQFGLLDAANNIIVIAGPRPEVGKSFMSVNLAAVLASGGKRILLIDADMRRGDLHGYFGVSREPGLSDVIAGLDISGAVLRDVLPNLDVLPKGLLPPNPAELLMSERFKTVLEQVSSLYDIVIVDTPPLLAVTDAALIGKNAGTTLLVVRHGRHPMAEILECTNRLRNVGVALKGVLITDVPQRRLGYGTYYYSYESNAK